MAAREASTYLACSVGALLRWARRGEVPSVKLPSGAIRFVPETIQAWVAECEVARSAEELPNALTHRAADGHGPSEFSSPNARPPLAASTEEEDHAC